MNPQSDINLNAPEWDYTKHASSYSARPNYAPKAIDELCQYVGAKKTNFFAADVGAGTANLTMMLLERGLTCIAIEPNAAMRKIGMGRTTGKNVKWLIGTGEKTGLENESVDWFVMGSSFNTTERQATLKEAARALKSKGYFSCMWNNRDLDNDPVQLQVEKIIRKYVPNYTHGTRREDQTNVILSSNLFDKIKCHEVDQKVTRSLDQYIDAWNSVRNEFWDVTTPQGAALYAQIIKDIRQELSSSPTLELTYTTRIWTVQKIK